MGLDYSYILYFEHHKQWEALQAVVDIASHRQPPTIIVFPDHILNVPLETWSSENGEYRFDDPNVSFHFSINFEEDEAIDDYIKYRDKDDPFRSPPDALTPRTVSIGYIYLDIRNNNSEYYFDRKFDNLVAFNFGTTGTHMSLLFDQSISIRRKFIDLLERVPGICGVFNREESGIVFWYKGQIIDEEIPDPYLTPSEIKTMFGLNG